MHERIAIITGSNRGIGKETARALALQKYTVVMACRNIEKANLACEDIQHESSNTNVYSMELDIGSRASIRLFVKRFVDRFSYVNVLINNAGLTSRTYEKTVDGLEKVVGTNYFGTYFLTRLLIPYFEQGKDNRVVNLCSDIYKFGKFSIEKLNDYHWVKAYAVSKYLILLFTLELAERLKGSGITVNAVHPGVVRTTIMMTNRWYDSIIHLILLPLYINEVEGAQTSIYVASSDEVQGETGKYYIKCEPREIAKRYTNKELRKRVWEESEKMFKSI